MLWAIFDDDACRFIDDRIVMSVKAAYRNLGNGLEAGENPVSKVDITVTNIEGGMLLSDLMEAEEEYVDGGNDVQVANDVANDNGNDDRNTRSDPSRNVRRRVGDSNEVSGGFVFLKFRYFI